MASTAQNNEDFPKALEYYKELKTYINGLNRHNSLTFDIINVDAYINDMKIAAARERYEKGKTAMAAGKYKAAIDHFNAALRFKSGFMDAKQLVAECHYLWAERKLGNLKYYEASEQFNRQYAEQRIPRRPRSCSEHLSLDR